MLPFTNIAIIGLGLIGSSIAHAVRETMPSARLTGFDSDPATRARVIKLGFCDDISDSAGAAVTDADLVMLCVPVGVIGEVAAEIAADLPDDAIVSDVGSSKESVLTALTKALPNARIIPAHPVAGTEDSGPDAGFATLFQERWCILTPPEDAAEGDIERVKAFWEKLGANIEIMDAKHHDLVLAVTSHLPHLIAYTIVGTAS
ncbi:MAG: prephenate dehydrogenase/arogenate dehydrogenase family protein, partial [Parasphingorhabdus sp.]